MAIPLIIGAAVLGGVAAVASLRRKKGEEKSNNEELDNVNVYYEDDEEEIEEMRAQAQKARRAKERKEKLKTKRDFFTANGNQIFQEIEKSLSGMVEIKSKKKPFNLSLAKFTGKIDFKENSVVDGSKFNLLDNNTKMNFKVFESVYDIELSMGADLIESNERLKEIDDKISKIESIQKEFFMTRDEKDH